jgi:hypothetical protein
MVFTQQSGKISLTGGSQQSFEHGRRFLIEGFIDQIELPLLCELVGKTPNHY